MPAEIWRLLSWTSARRWLDSAQDVRNYWTLVLGRYLLQLLIGTQVSIGHLPGHQHPTRGDEAETACKTCNEVQFVTLEHHNV